MAVLLVDHDERPATPPEFFVAVDALCGRLWGRGRFVDAVWNITTFIPIHRSWTLEVAAETGAARLLRMLLSRPRYGDIDPRYIGLIVNRGLDVAAAAGNLQVFEDFGRYFPGLVITHAAAIAARHGHTHIITWLFTWPRVLWHSGVFAAAAQFGSVAGVRRLLEGLSVPPDPSLLRIALEHQHHFLVQWLAYTFASAGDEDVLRRAMELADPATATWILTMHPHLLLHHRLNVDDAASRGDLAWLVWSQRHPTSATTRAMDDAAANGHIDVLKWLHQHRTEGYTTAAVEGAARRGHLVILVFLRDECCQGCSEHALFLAAVNGHLDVLQWFHDAYSLRTLPASLFDDSARAGQLHVIEWMTDVRLSTPTHRAMDWAATSGHLDVVMYLHEHRAEGCTTAALDGATANGHLLVVEFLDEFRFEGCTPNAFDGAALHGHHDILFHLQLFHGNQWSPRALLNAARGGQTRVVQMMIMAYRVPVTLAVKHAAIASGCVQLVEYISTVFGFEDTMGGINAAVEAGQFEVVEYLQLLESVSCSPTAVLAAVQDGNLYLASWAYSNCPNPPSLHSLTQSFKGHGWSSAVVEATFF